MINLFKHFEVFSIVIIILTGLNLSFNNSFKNVYRLDYLFKSLFIKNKYGKRNISTLTISLGAKIGVGSLAGVAIAISDAGIGSIFWMWITTLIISSNGFFESYLGAKYNKKIKNQYYGGPQFYSKNVTNKLVTFLLVVIIFLTYTVGYVSIQSNVVTTSINNLFNINKLFIGMILVLLFLILINNNKSIKTISNIIVPSMSLLFIISLLLILFKNNISILDNIKIIINNGLNIKSITMGSFFTMIIVGFKRGVFSNEAGLGSASIASGSSDTKNYSNQGYMQVLGIYFTTLIISTLTAIIIYNYNNVNNYYGIVLTIEAFKYYLGTIGSIIIGLSIFFFGFSTIISSMFYGNSVLKVYKKDKDIYKQLKILIVIIILISSIINSKILLNIVDFFIILLALLNSFILLKYRKEIKKI